MRYGWSHSARDWAALNALGFTSREWCRTPFVYPNAIRVPGSPGVYAIGSRPPTLLHDVGLPFAKLYTLLYVGQSSNLRRRFSDHSRAGSQLRDTIGAVFSSLDFWWMTCPQESLDEFEARLIVAFGPTANRNQGIVARVGPSHPA